MAGSTCLPLLPRSEESSGRIVAVREIGHTETRSGKKHFPVGCGTIVSKELKNRMLGGEEGREPIS